MILLHGSYGSRSDTIHHLRMLVAAGYAVLAYDVHGQSEGQTNAVGWHGDDDIAGALAFLHRQHGIDPRQIAALGLSMGGEEALRAAADGVPLRAVIADGAGASTLGDKQLVAAGLTAPVALSTDWLTMRMTELLTGEKEPPSLHSIVGRIHIPVLLIASTRAGERTLDQKFRDQIGQNASLWYVPDAGHTESLTRHPDVYAARVEAFLRTALSSG